VRMNIKGELLKWARERAGLTVEALRARFPKLDQWEAGTAKPTLKQIEDYAKATNAPVGFLFLSEPPDEPMPIPDFRTMAGKGVQRISPNLRDMIYACQQL